MPEKYYRLPKVREFAAGLSTTTIYRLMGEGKFPRPVRIGGRAVAWKESDLLQWQAARSAA